MREIKFRYTFKHIGTGNIEKKIYTLKQLEERNTSELSPCFNAEFGYELVSRDQYTGLKDKNGTEIFDGDIVKISDHPFQGSIDIDGNYEVGYNEYMELSCGGWYLFRMRHWAEVIGNKFENPELLKGDEENEGSN